MNWLTLLIMAQWAPGDWPMYKYDPARTGRAPAVGNFTDTSIFYVRWWDGAYSYGPLPSAPCIIDVNQDGVWDIIFALPIKDSIEGTPGALWVNDGLDRWAFPFFFGDYTGTPNPPVAGDFDGDGEKEVTVYTCQGRLFVLRVGPDPSWNAIEFCYRLVDSAAAPPGATAYIASPLACDLDGDGKIEIITGSATRENYFGAPYVGDTVFCFKAQGSDAYTLEWKRTYGDHYFVAPPAAADIDGDGDLEIAMVSYKGFVICIDHDGTLRWSVQLRPDSTFKDVPIFGDLTGNGVPDLLIPRTGPTSATPTPGTSLWAFDASGNLLWTYDSVIQGSPSLCDLNDDGAMDVLINSYWGYSEYTVALKGKDGSRLWRVMSYIVPQIFDVNGDGQEEIITADRGILAIRKDGFALWEFPTGVSSSIGTPGTPLMADFDGDGFGEIFTAGGSCHMAVIDADSAALPVSERVAGPRRFMSVEPRVFRGAFRINLSFPEEREVELTLYDFTGKRIELVYEGVTKEKTITHTKPLKPGVYVLVLRGEEVHERMSLLRAP
ncbi:MAG: T9SS type A sorting domain-containing protein [candidate division WOR-3 bacterium]